LSVKGKGSEFEQLCKKVSKDLSPPAVLKELERLSIVSQSKQGVTLEQAQVEYAPDPDRILDLFARDIDTFADAVEENVYASPEDRNTHLRTEFDNLFMEDLPEIKRWLRAESKRFHKKVRDHLASHDADIVSAPERKAGGRAVLTAVSFVELPEESS
jgi:hypothetical protein